MGSGVGATGSVRMSDPADARYEAGMQVRTEVLGAEHVQRAEARKTPLDADFQRFITETAWGMLWTRPGWTGGRAAWSRSRSWPGSVAARSWSCISGPARTSASTRRRSPRF